uniref:Transcription termination factor 2 n=1 Tax=Panagrolaimus superbus TaxID=310955 RepID=A0A914ZAY7_9BILA
MNGGKKAVAISTKTSSSSSSDASEDEEIPPIILTADEKKSVKDMKKEDVLESLKILKKIDPSNATDGGKKIMRRIALLEDRLQLPFEIKVVETKPKPKVVDLDPYIKGDKRLYGGKMTDKRKEKIAAVTEEIIEQIHGSLDSMPENVVTETPTDLTVDLMLHQKYGLTWMKWRENNEAPHGGILADDMGLGKTLSMISLIVSQKNDRKNSKDVKEKLDVDMNKHFSCEKDVHPGYCTLVVAPASVIYQWEKEIKDRVKPGTLKVYVFHGPRRERDPKILAKNDIVITTYNTISSELGEDKDLIGQESDEDGTEDKWYSKDKSGNKKKISKRNTKSVLTQIGWERIILDEAHNIKNRNSLMSKGCCRLLAFKRWALTGTPIHNELWDFYSLVKFLRISPFSDQGYWKEHMSNMSGKVATERLNTLVKSILLRRTKNQICSVTNKPLVNLKPRRFEVVEIQLEGAEEKCYQHMMEASKQKAKELINQQNNQISHPRKGTNVIKNPFIVGKREVDLDDKFQMMSCLLVLLLRLRQACVHMALTKQAIDLDAFKDDGGEGVGDVMDELEKTFGNITLGVEGISVQDNNAIGKIFETDYASGKLKVLLEKIDKVIESGDKCVVVSQWTSMLNIVEQHLRKKKLNLTAINGKVLTKDRQERINSFNQKNGGAQVMLLSLTAGGVGLNLIGGNHLFLLDLHWNPALEQQACDRIYRVGQTKDVFIHKLICKNTIEQRVLDLQERKVQLAASVLEGAAKKQNKLTVNDLKFLFGLTKEQQPKTKESYQGPNNFRIS